MNDNWLPLVSEKQVKEHNRDAWDRLAASGCRFARPAATTRYRNAAEMLVKNPWLPDSVAGLRVLALASGGGGQSGIFASQGANVTVVDISPAMLERDRELARTMGLPIRVVEASMDHMPMLADGEFDLVVHPVSTCYVRDVRAVFAEVARVTKPGATYVSHHKQPMSMQVGAEPVNGTYPVLRPYRFRGPLPPVTGKMHREDGTMEFLHTWGDLLGGLCGAGFAINDFKEVDHSDPTAAPGSFGHRSAFVPPFMSIKATRKQTAAPGEIIVGT